MVFLTSAFRFLKDGNVFGMPHRLISDVPGRLSSRAPGRNAALVQEPLIQGTSGARSFLSHTTVKQRDVCYETPQRSMAIPCMTMPMAMWGLTAGEN